MGGIVIKKIFIGMFFWLPLLYSAVFLVISLLTRTVGGNWGFYFVGLSVVLLICVVLTYVYAHRSREESTDKARAEEERQDLPAVSAAPAVSGRRGELVPEEEAEISARDETNRYAAEMKGSPSSVNGERYDSRSERSAYMAGGRYIDDVPAPDPRSAPDSLRSDGDMMGGQGMNGYYFGEPEEPAAPNGGKTDSVGFSPYVQPSNYGEGGMKLGDYDRRARRDERETPAQEINGDGYGETDAPRIYRLRGEPNVLLYEYPDVYKKYYINADGSSTLLSTQYKENK